MPTAHLEDAAEGILRSAFARSGQKCSACSRVYVHQKCGADLVALLAERIQEFAIGDPTRRETDMGPLIDAGAVETYRQAVRLGDKSGRRVAGGNVFSAGDLAHGYFVEPTLYDRVAKDCALMREEFLGPVLAVAEVKHVQEAIECCNGGPYGLTAGIFTQVDHEQEQFFNQVEAGSLYCNRREGATTSGTPGVRSFGGWKASGSTGKNALGPYYVAQFMREQCRTICW
jgi:1-pyrroline-5-carboxylate dehydrogenase